MRMTLVEVHLRNFRIHEDYRFRPASKGITSIIGDNGHGKSSIIDGIAWALYGAKPDGSLKTSDLRRIGADVKDECYVEVTMILDGGRTLRVKRSIHRKSSVQCDCWMNGVLESGGSVSTADRWIPGVLGIDKDGFLSAVLVQQKQVGDIVSESASVRQRNIERLTGITAATEAVKLAREEANSLKRAMDMAAPDVEDMDSIRKALADSEEELKTVTEQRSGLRADNDKEKEEFGRLSERLDKARKRADEYDGLKHDADLSKQHVQDLQSRLNDMSDRLQRMKSGLPKLKDPKGLEEEHDKAYERLQLLNGRKAGYDTIIADDVPTRTIKKARTELDSMNAPEGDRDDLVSAADKARSGAAASRQNLERYRRSLEALDKGDGEVTCPTCLQPIHDIGHVRDEFDRLIKEAETSVRDHETDAESMERSIKSYDKMLSDMEKAKAELDDMTSKHDAAIEAKREMAAMKPDMETLSRKVKTLAGKISDVKANARILREYETYSKDFTRVADEYSKAESVYEKSAAELKGMNSPSRKTIHDLERKLERSRSRLVTIRDEAIGLKGRKELLDERVSNAKESLERAHRQERERAMVRRRYEVSQNSLNILTAFREHLASQAVPQITDYASDLLADITGGRFMAVIMDERYSISVKREDGSTLDVHMLSGGERDTVAICLRLAISMMLSGGEPSMLILDEVLTAMDDTMSSAILKAIQASGHGQVIIIAHNDIVSTIADKPVEL